MKTSAVAIIVIAGFIGCLSALQVDRYLSHRSVLGHGAVPPELLAQPVAYDQVSGGPADFRAASKKVIPSVVSVDRYQRIDSFFDQDSTIQETASGSGVIISSDGTIVTNNHVVEGATEVRVHLPDKRTVTAEVVGVDRVSDLAVLRVKADGLTPIEMGDSDKLEVGQWVVAVGNPLGYAQTVSVGVVSNKARSLGTEGNVLVNAIQTDAAINPGNSGGALTDADGRLVGINAAISSNTGTNIGIGFAIPVNRVKRVAREIIETGHAHNPYLGLNLANPNYDGLLATDRGRQEVADAVHSSNVPSVGVLVPPNGRRYPTVAPDGPAAKAGIKPLDIILAIDGTPTNDRLDYFAALDNKRPGDKLTIKFWSQGSTKTVTITLAEEPIES
jgi:S1-C subfamily serine protease